MAGSMTDESQRHPSQGPVGAVPADRIVGVYPIRMVPVKYGRGTTLLVVLVLLVLFLVFSGLIWIWLFPP